MSDLREHFQAIYEERGRLTPHDVVDVARDPAHPLHSQLNWDNDAAAEAWRLRQAQDLIRSVKWTYVDRAGVKQQTRAFVAVYQPLAETDGEPEVNGGYRYLPTEVVAKDELLARQTLAEMEREWKTLRKRYDQFAEFWRLVRSEADEVPEAA